VRLLKKWPNFYALLMPRYVFSYGIFRESTDSMILYSCFEKDFVMMKVSTVLGILVLATSLTACGHSQGDRAISGAGIGAGVGALGSAVTGGDAGTGAIVGGVVGGAAGGLTRSRDVDLGRPIWR
jgi:hypothetical protein